MATQSGRATWLLLGAFLLGVLLSCGGGDDGSGDGTSAAPANDIGISGARKGVVGTGSASAVFLPDADTDPPQRVVCLTPIRPAALRHRRRAASVPTQLPACPGGSRAARFAATTSTDVQAQAAAAAAALTFAAPEFTTEVVATLSPFSVVGMAWAPDGRLFVWQKNGIVRVIKQGVLLPTPFIDLSAKVNTFDDRGFWGLAFHPNFAGNGYVYLSYMFEGGGNPERPVRKTSRLTRVTANPSNPDVAMPGSEVIVLGTIGTPPAARSLPGPTASRRTVAVIPSGRCTSRRTASSSSATAMAATEIRHLSLRAQDLNSYSGKILRINDDGTAPSDNPFYDGTNSIRSKVWLYGVQESLRLRHPPGTEATSTSARSAGTPGKRSTADSAGANYGWPCYEGAGLQPFFQSFAQCQSCLPSAVEPPPSTPMTAAVGAAAIGGSFYTGKLYPHRVPRQLLLRRLRRQLDPARRRRCAEAPLSSMQPFATNVQAPVIGQDGPGRDALLPVVHDGQISRIRFNGTQAEASATPVMGTRR